MTDDCQVAAERALTLFSAWLDDISPRHRALRTPVYLEEDAPALVRAVWRQIGWSPAVGTRPERTFADRAAEKKALGWFSAAKIRESWNVTTPEEALRAVRAKLPAKSRFVPASGWGSAIAFTDETSGNPDPPVWHLDRDGSIRLRWPSYVERFIWSVCRRIAGTNDKSYDGPPLPGEQPFAPLFCGFWTIHDGIWALGECPMVDDRDQSDPPRPTRLLGRSSIEYFDYVRALPDELVRPFFGGLNSDKYLAVDGLKELDPADPKVPGYRRVSDCDGMVELDGVRFWVSKHHQSPCAAVHVPPSQFGSALNLLRQRDIEVYEHDYPPEDDAASANETPGADEFAAVRGVHDQARAAAGVTR